MRQDFEGILAQLRAQAENPAHQGQLFERLMKRFFHVDPIYADRFENIWLWQEWPDRSGPDVGIDLVAEESEGGLCAIQCKFYKPGVTISKPQIDSFIAASNRKHFTNRLLVNTGAELGPNARRMITGVQPTVQLLRFGDLADRPFHWPDLAQPEELRIDAARERYALRPHQQEALDAVAAGLEKSARGRMIMPCGTGKTFTALNIAEQQAGRGGRVLYLEPSIALLGQTMREWAEHKSLPHRYIGICSDTRAGKNDEDASLSELEIPVTTQPEKIRAALSKPSPDALTAVFCTYQSLPLVEWAQREGAPEFQLALCDEAHRTTGVEKPGDRHSPFVLIHNAEKIRAKKRLYMTATPRIYTERARAKARERDTGVYSMDDEAQFGPELHHLNFSKAVEDGLLSDYKVVVLNIGERFVNKALQNMVAHGAGGPELRLPDAAKILGCWRALEAPEGPNAPEIGPLRRAIAFTNRIRDSKIVKRNWKHLVDQAIQLRPPEQRGEMLRCQVRHVDGQQNAFERKAGVDWLKQGAESACTILSNARCLSEGIDVPALDAVLFMQPRSSQVDVVQAVGRVMRKSPGKQYGYIILPVFIPAGVDPVAALDDNERYATVWNVLRALRSHDDRFDAEINKIDLNQRPHPSIIGIAIDEGGDTAEMEEEQLPFDFSELPMEAFCAKVVEKCGDRQYWEIWAKDIAEIASLLTTRIEGLLESGPKALKQRFDSFLNELRAAINAAVSQGDAVSMLAQHMITGPVFNALFENYNFANSNPVARALSEVTKLLEAHGLQTETRDLERFYDSVRRRAQDLDNSAARQRVLIELYEKFFKTALPRETARLGIVYTPTEVVDFILHSADAAMRREFNRGLTDENVHILDPFTGTGVFLARLLQSELIRDEDLERKFRSELHANEIVLLAYYIAAVNIEEAFRGRRISSTPPPPRGRETAGYLPFGGIVLCDTFNLAEENVQLPELAMPDNDARRKRQRGERIEVIVGNPPYSAWQKSSDDDNPNVSYPALEGRVRDTYAARTAVTNKSSLYDTYKMAIRWATDRIEDTGVIAFVTNGSFIDGNADAGLRACLAEDFNSIYVFNLRGNARTSGEPRQKECGNVFGQGSRAPVAITILVKNPDAGEKTCRIFYKDIGDYLNQKEKLAMIQESESVEGVSDWIRIEPDENCDWLNQRDADYQNFEAVGDSDAKRGKSQDAIFRLYSLGIKTKRDAWLYNFSRNVLSEQTKIMTAAYERVLRQTAEDSNLLIRDVINSETVKINWDSEILDRLSRGAPAPDQPHAVRLAAYRPFVKGMLAFNLPYIQRTHQIPKIFPESNSGNLAICAAGRGAVKPFSVLMVDMTPDLELISKGQLFPLYTYELTQNTDPNLPGVSPRREKRENILDEARTRFRLHYEDNSISKKDIFYYTYGLLHSPAYRERYRNDLAKDLPRIPFAPDFRAFAEAGRKLGKLHIGYETCKRHRLRIEFTGEGKPRDQHFRLTEKKMRFAKGDSSTLIVNEHIRLCGIPAEAHEYEVNGRTPLGWLMDRYHITTDKKTGNTNDPNAWFANPRDLVAAIERIVHMSIETARIVKALPNPLP